MGKEFLFLFLWGHGGGEARGTILALSVLKSKVNYISNGILFSV